MKIQVLGVGCPKCIKMFEAAAKAAELLGGGVEVEKVYDLDKIAGYGVVSFPGLAVDGKVVSTGRMLAPEEIAALVGKER